MFVGEAKALIKSLLWLIIVLRAERCECEASMKTRYDFICIDDPPKTKLKRVDFDHDNENDKLMAYLANLVASVM